MNRRRRERLNWWAESAVLFAFFTIVFAVMWRWLADRDAPWAEVLLQGAVFGIGMVVFLSWQVRRARQSKLQRRRRGDGG